MKTYQVFCSNCYQHFTDEWWLCPSCNGSLSVNYFEEKEVPQFPVGKKVAGLAEGNTPLIFLPNLSKQFEIELWAKCESQNPTGSFKDRGSIIEIAKSLELGRKGVVCASTGNMAASLAAYAARYSLTCKMVIPASTPESKLQQALECGATLVKVEGTYDACISIAQKIADEEDFFLCGDYLLRREGQKTIGYELADKNFDAFVVPVGNGTVGVAIALGFSEATGVESCPAFIGVQAATVNPIELAWKTNTPIVAQKNTQTIASAFNVGSPLDGNLTLNWIQKTAGAMTTVTDTEIVSAQQTLASLEGLYVESTAASTLAGLLKMKNQLREQKIVLILTGSGLKERR